MIDYVGGPRGDEIVAFDPTTGHVYGCPTWTKAITNGFLEAAWGRALVRMGGGGPEYWPRGKVIAAVRLYVLPAVREWQELIRWYHRPLLDPDANCRGCNRALVESLTATER